MTNFKSWLLLVAKCLGLGLVLTLVGRFILKFTVTKSLESVGLVFLVLAIIFFITTGPRKYRDQEQIISATMEAGETGERNKKDIIAQRGDIYYVLAFGLVGLVFLFIPILI